MHTSLFVCLLPPRDDILAIKTPQLEVPIYNDIVSFAIFTFSPPPLKLFYTHEVQQLSFDEHFQENYSMAFGGRLVSVLKFYF